MFNRLIVALAMPLLVTSIVPLLISALIGHASLTIAFISSLNVIAASVDILGIFGLLFKMPRATVIRMNGLKGYWKLAKNPAKTAAAEP